MKTLHKIGDWLENNIIPFALGFFLGILVILVRIS